jgi:hypothetical protein
LFVLIDDIICSTHRQLFQAICYQIIFFSDLKVQNLMNFLFLCNYHYSTTIFGTIKIVQFLCCFVVFQTSPSIYIYFSNGYYFSLLPIRDLICFSNSDFFYIETKSSPWISQNRQNSLIIRDFYIFIISASDQQQDNEDQNLTWPINFYRFNL